MAGLTESYCRSNETSHASQFKWLDNTFNSTLFPMPYTRYIVNIGFYITAGLKPGTMLTNITGPRRRGSVQCYKQRKAKRTMEKIVFVRLILMVPKCEIFILLFFTPSSNWVGD